ncbi:MAG: MFS transporter [Candidatus Pacearchaeota archaeon]
MKKERNVKLLGASSFLNDIGSDMIAPLLPFYISTLGGAGIALGLLSGMREGLASLLKIFGGWMSDKIGKRKVFVFWGYFISVIFRFMFIAASSWQLLVGFVGLERFGKTRDAPRDAIIEDSEPKEKVGKAFAFQQMLDTSGAVLGTLILIFLLWQFNLEIKTMIIIASLISMFCLVPIFFVKEPKFKKTRKNLLSGISSLSPRMKYFVFVSGVFSLGNFGLYLFLVARGGELSGSIIVPLIMYALFSAAYAFTSVPFGKLSDKIGRKKVLVLGYILFLVLSIGFIFVENVYAFAGLFTLYGLVYSITQPTSRALIADFSREIKGTAMGFYYFVTGIVTIPAGLIAGLLWNISSQVMFSYISVVALIALVLLNFVKER